MQTKQTHNGKLTKHTEFRQTILRFIDEMTDIDEVHS